ncbi:unnamed protein product [Ascophyllum nodosum]
MVHYEYRRARQAPTSFGYLRIVFVLYHTLQVVGFISPLICHTNAKRTSSWRLETCALKMTLRDGDFKDGDDTTRSSHENETDTSFSRPHFLKTLGRVGFALMLGQQKVVRAEESTIARGDTPMVGKITKNGVKYFEYRVGEGDSPRWGQDCVIRFTMYGRTSPDSKLIKIQSSDDNLETYLFKHGNGRQLKGMEEGLHTMRVGGKRRIIFPPQLGFSVQGLGPYPAYPRKRDTLVKVLQSFEKTNKGELVMDVELLEAFDDEADQGYYEDETVSPEELQEILAETSRFSGGVSVPFEKLPGQVAEPMVE